MNKLSIIFSCAIFICLVFIIFLVEQGNDLKQQVKYYKDQNRMSNELYEKYKAESDRCWNSWNERNNTVSTLFESVDRLKKQNDSLFNIAYRKKLKERRVILDSLIFLSNRDTLSALDTIEINGNKYSIRSDSR